MEHERLKLDVIHAAIYSNVSSAT